MQDSATRPPRVVGLGGSLGRHSTSLAALRIALASAAADGMDTDLFDIRELNLPMFDPDQTRLPEPAARLCEAVSNADGMIWSSPLYQGTISGSFKNALDWLHDLGSHDPPFLTDKIIGLICVAGGTQGLQAINTMEFAVRALRAWAVPLVVPIPTAWQAFDEQGALRDEQVGDLLRALGREVARAVRQARGQPLAGPDARRAAAAVQPLTLNEAGARR